MKLVISNVLQLFITVFSLSIISVSGKLNDSCMPLPSHDQNGTECPTWFFYNTTAQDCQCLPHDLFACKGNDSFIDSDYILTYDSRSKNKVVSAVISKRYQFLKRVNQTLPGYRLLPKNISLLNVEMCGPLNRKGYMCSTCIDGFGPSLNLMVDMNTCYDCAKHWYGIIMYLFIEFVPITLFYLVILVFQIGMTSAPMTCFIMYCQLTIMALYIAWNDKVMSRFVYNSSGELLQGAKLILALHGVLNLDFFRYTVPPFCVSSHLTAMHRIFLGYISAFYPILLIILTWLCIELHDRNVEFIVMLCKPFIWCFIRLRKSWNVKSDLINVFATFFLLSYTKILYQTYLMFMVDTVYSYSLMDVNYTHSDYVLNSGDSIKLNSATLAISATFAVVMAVLFNIIPLLFMALYPVRIFRRMLQKCKLDWAGVMIFMEKFHSCYKDGLDGGRDMRSFSVLYFLLRVFVVLVVSVIYQMTDQPFAEWFLYGVAFSFTALFIALFRPYKKTYVNVCDTLILTNLALLCYIMSSENDTKDHFAEITQTIILLPFIVLVLTIALRLTRKILRSHRGLVSSLRDVAMAAFRTTAKGLSTNRGRNIHRGPVATYGTFNNELNSSV